MINNQKISLSETRQYHKVVCLAFWVMVFILIPLLIPHNTFAETTSSTTPAKCDMVFQGYIYSETTGLCTAGEATGCQNPFLYNTQEICENNNDIKVPHDKTNDTDRAGTILDKVKADRQSFIKDRLYNTDTENDDTLDISILSGQILQVNRQVLLLELTQSITKTHDQIIYLENIINRLRQRLAELGDEATTERIDNILIEAEFKIANASSTLSFTQASSTAIITADPLGPTLSSIKTDIIETIKELKGSQNLIRSAILETKKII